jgi:diaminohydroxyphosphoribosylaminopyrimidine deaminase/5-amino-6-(5-phosphoribosylamino)uracil reductase
MVAASDDARAIERALFLAERGRGRTSPNPMVGAVVLSPAGVVVGQGHHAKAGEAHAEVVALDAAGDRARGATLYCTLEPCAHTGRTGPCVERIVAAGITRVVASMRDPNPLVSGTGFEFLRAHGVGVSAGLGEAEARRLNAPFVRWITRGRPWVTVKTVVSADGFAGRDDGRVHLTGEAANRFFHRERAEVDAIAVGSGTMRIDDPHLTARRVYRERPLLRVLFDWRLRVPASARVFSTLAEGPVIMVVLRGEVESRQRDVEQLRAAGAEFELFDARDLAAVLDRLGNRGVLSLLVEAGPRLHRAFAEADLIDRLQWVRTPAVLGQGIPEAWHAGAGSLPGGSTRHLALGDDILMETDVHRTD